MLTITKSSFVISSYSSFWFPLIAVLARLSSSTAEISFFIIAGYALLGKQQALQALVLLFLFTTLNDKIAPSVEFISLLRYIVIFSAFFSIFLRANFLKYNLTALYTLCFAVFIIIHSMFFSSVIEVSVLKIISCTIVMITLLKAWGELNELEYDRMKKWVERFILFILLSSLPFLLIPEVGYEKNNIGFQGVLNHPQAFGILAALSAAIFFGIFFEKIKFSWSLISILFLILWLVFLSKARTAGMAIFFSLFITVIINFSKKNFYLSTSQYNRLLFFIFLFLIFFLLLNSDSLYVFKNFISKSNEEEISSVLNYYFQSRKILLDPMFENINKNFITGIGFGISSDPLSMDIEKDPFLNLAIGAPYEKGTLFIAVLEELGIFGFILFVIWIFILLYRATINSFSSLLVLTTILLINIGEAILFSPGGTGLILIILLTSLMMRPKLLNLSASKYPKN
jgi:hypothetical protein